ncbi:hypothetical protein IID23_02230 [Patescibacteria group bacterium]|nr:hypothetical protein [Patescibacteria group bacterium]
MLRKLAGKIFGSDKVIEGGMNAIDKMFFTDEEKSDAKMALLKLYEPFKLAQRYLACIFGIPYALGWFVTLIASFFINVEVQQEILKGDISIVVMIIVGFYFTGGTAESILNAVKGVRK